MKKPARSILLRVPVGTLENGTYVTPKDVRREDKWALWCAECGEPITLKCEASELRRAHFAHCGTPKEGKPQCFGGETAIHKICIDLLAGKELEILLPVEKEWVEAKLMERGTGSINHLLDNYPNWAPETLKIQAGRKEVTRQSDNGEIRADLIAQSPIGEIAIEIHVHHAKAAKERSIFRRLKLPCIEIHMGFLLKEIEDGINFARIEETLLRGKDNRSWVASPNEDFLLQADAEFHKRMAKLQERRTEAIDWPQTIIASAPEESAKRVFFDENGREIVVVQSFSSSESYEPDDGIKRIAKSRVYLEGPKSDIKYRWSPVYRKDLLAAIETSVELRWLTHLIENLNEDAHLGLTGDFGAKALPLPQNPHCSALDTILDKAGNIQHTFRIAVYPHKGKHCGASLYKAASQGIGTVVAWTNKGLPPDVQRELDFLNTHDSKCWCPKWWKIDKSLRNQWMRDIKGPHLRINPNLLVAFPVWAHKHIRRLEEDYHTVFADFYLDITQSRPGPRPELSQKWVYYFQILFKKNLICRFLTRTGEDNRAFDAAWFEDNLDACINLDNDKNVGGNV